MVQTITVALAQLEVSFDIQKNYEQVERMAKKAAEKHTDIFCLPELFSTPYFAQYETCEKDYSERIPDGPTSLFLSRLAKENNLIIVGGTICEAVNSSNAQNNAKKYYNTCVVFGSHGEIISKYRKIHLPQDPCYYEQNYFLHGDLGYVVAETSKCNIGTLICFDQWYPEPARILSLLGADIIVYPTAIGYIDGVQQAEGDWHDAWVNVMRGHAIANAIPIIAVNRVGREGSMDFWGGSFVCDAFGKIIARAEKREHLVFAEIDLDHSKSIRNGWGFFAHRHHDTYSLICQDIKLDSNNSPIINSKKSRQENGKKRDI